MTVARGNDADNHRFSMERILSTIATVGSLDDVLAALAVINKE